MRRKIQCVGVWDMAQATTKSKGRGRTSGSTEEGCPIKQIKVASRTRLLPPATQGRARGIRLRGMQKAKERGAWPCVFTSGSSPLLLSDGLLASRPLLSLGLLARRSSWLPSSGCGCGPKEPHGVSYSPFFALQPHTPQARTTSCCPCYSCSLSGLNGLVFIRCQFLTSHSPHHPLDLLTHTYHTTHSTQAHAAQARRKSHGHQEEDSLSRRGTGGQPWEWSRWSCSRGRGRQGQAAAARSSARHPAGARHAEEGGEAAAAAAAAAGEEQEEGKGPRARQ